MDEEEDLEEEGRGRRLAGKRGEDKQGRIEKVIDGGRRVG